MKNAAQRSSIELNVDHRWSKLFCTFTKMYVSWLRWKKVRVGLLENSSWLANTLFCVYIWESHLYVPTGTSWGFKDCSEVDSVPTARCVLNSLAVWTWWRIMQPLAHNLFIFFFIKNPPSGISIFLQLTVACGVSCPQNTYYWNFSDPNLVCSLCLSRTYFKINFPSALLVIEDTIWVRFLIPYSTT